MPTTEEVKSYYDGFVTYLKKDRERLNPRHKAIFNIVDLVGNIKQINSVLEIGCGIGIISEYMKQYVDEVCAVDISETNIEYARQTVKDVEFLCGDIFKVNLACKKFDLIALFDVLEHIPLSMHRKLFKQLLYWSHDDTIIAITIPDADYLDYVRKQWPEKLQIIDESIYFYPFLEMLRSFQLEVLMYQKYGIDCKNQYQVYLLEQKKLFELLPPTLSGRG